MKGDKYEVISDVYLPEEERMHPKNEKIWYWGPQQLLKKGTILEFLNNKKTYLFGGVKVMRIRALDGSHKNKVFEICNRKELSHLKKIWVESTVN